MKTGFYLGLLMTAALSSSAFALGEGTMVCGKTSLTIGDDGSPSLTLPQGLKAKKKYTAIVTRKESVEEYIYKVDNGTSETLEYVFQGLSTCAEEDTGRLRIYGVLPTSPRTFVTEVKCTCGEA